MGQVANAATAMLGSTAYVFPGDPCKGDKERFSCHYECDASLGAGAQWKAVRDAVSADRNVTQSITWVGPAAAGGALGGKSSRGMSVSTSTAISSVVAILQRGAPGPRQRVPNSGHYVMY